MPPAIIAAAIGAAATAAEVGVQISGAGQPGSPKPTPAAAPAGPTANQVAAAAGPQALTIESLTGGSVSPDYLSQIAPTQAGVGGQPNTNAGIQQILNQIFGKGGGGTPSTTTPGGTPSFTPSGLGVNLSALAATPGTSDFLTKIAGGL